MTTDVPEPASPDEHAIAAKKFLRRIERLSTDLVTPNFKRGEDLWTFQIRLFNLQGEIQKAITRVKKLPRKDPERRKAIGNLEDIRWHARRLGDAFAWVCFGLDRRALRALAGNTRVPVSPERGHRDAAMMAIAGQLASFGWGFPILHDVTDCLRIGDITFIKPDEDTDSHKLTTVEMKTRLLSQQPEGDNQTKYNYEVSAITGLTNEQFTELGLPVARVDEPAATPDDERHRPPRKGRPDRRIEGQLRRLDRAVAHQSAPLDEIVNIPGVGPFVASRFGSDAKSYWKILRRIIRNARKEGYASESVESAILYVAIYSETGITEEHVKDDRMPEDIVSSGMFFEDQPSRNSLIVNQIPSVEHRAALTLLPFYLYSIPRRAVSDLIYGRLVLLVLLNPNTVQLRLHRCSFGSCRVRGG